MNANPPRTRLNAYAIGASIALAALLFYIGETFPSFQHALRSAGYVGTFVLGLLYVSSFTSLSAATLLFLIGRSQNIWLTGGLATLGAVVGDLVTFALFRSAKPFAAARPDPERYSGWWAAIEAHVPSAWQSFVLMSVVVVFLLLPLPNEFADYVLARTRRDHPLGHAGHFIGVQWNRHLWAVVAGPTRMMVMTFMTGAGAPNDIRLTFGLCDEDAKTTTNVNARRRPPFSVDPAHIEARRSAADCLRTPDGCSPSRPASGALPIQALEIS